MREVAHEDAHAELVADGEDARAQHAIGPEPAVAPARAACARSRRASSQLPTNSSISTRDAEQAREKGRAAATRSSPRGAISPAYSSLTKSETESRSRNAAADADHRADIVAEAVLLRPVVLGDRARVGPGAEEQLAGSGAGRCRRSAGRRRRARAASDRPRRSWSAAARPADRTCRETRDRGARGRSRPSTPPRWFEAGNSRYGFCESATNSSASGALSPMRGLSGCSRSSRRSTREQIEAPGLGGELVERKLTAGP